MSASGNRHMLRQLIRNGHSMENVDRLANLGLINMAVWARFHRLWAWSTATEHPLTRHVPLARWIARREKIREIVKKIVDKGA